MQTTSSLYQEILQSPLHIKEVKVLVSSVEYGEDRIVSLKTARSLFQENTLSIGGAVASEIDLVLYRPGKIPKMAELKPFYRLVSGKQSTEWIQKGVFYIDTRVPDNEADTLTIHGFDGMLKSEQVWEPVQSLSFPMSHRAAVREIARLMGVPVDNPQDISDRYTLDYPANGYTLRSVLRFVAAAHGGNFIMTDAGALRLVTLYGLPPETNYLVTEYGDAITFGGVRILV